MAKKFSASMRGWTEKAKRNIGLVRRNAIQKLFDGIKDDTPRVTGNARRSWILSTTAMPEVREGAEEFEDIDVAPVLAGLKSNVSAYIGGQAAYLPRLNYGFTKKDSLGRKYNQSGVFMVENNAKKWKTYVKESAQEIGKT